MGAFYMSFFTLPAIEGAPLVSWLSKGLESAEAAAPAATVATAAVSNLVKSAGMLTKIKGGLQGFVKGDPQAVYQALTKGATKLPSGAHELADGTKVMLYASHSAGELPTIQINTGEQIYKLRFVQ